ncbi:unnamed protein product [Nesidiocoris tenuis]|uniref:Uncharacterized protein n=1 Tax=Nesidiocoris tenuis TaxID=355587 RepID=A0A6H5GZJ1_9HEMI|nr:unnamed protein product [Nesidiocoris tenuis]
MRHFFHFSFECSRGIWRNNCAFSMYKNDLQLTRPNGRTHSDPNVFHGSSGVQQEGITTAEVDLLTRTTCGSRLAD